MRFFFFISFFIFSVLQAQNQTKFTDVTKEAGIDHIFDVYQGLFSLSPAGEANNVNIRMNAQSPESVIWKKIYIELRELVTASPNQSTFLQSFQANLDADDTEGVICLDNIKVIWF